MKILVLCEDYPNPNGGISMMFVHTRNVEYAKHHKITVLNFRANEKYEIDGIEVITERDYKERGDKYDLVIAHAANLKHHYKFLKNNKPDKIVFVFHGHEVLNINKTYPAPYSYVKDSAIKRILQNAYDKYKCRVWRKFFTKNQDKCTFIFVSEWMKNQFEKWVMPTGFFTDKVFITYNGISEIFEKNSYDIDSEKIYDSITVRGNLDGSKYCVDLVCDIARANPSMKFCLIGRGAFFNHFPKPDNVEWINSGMKHKEIAEYLDKSKCALMPTKTDAQGLMACEMASYGIPLITSDIDVCHEIFDDFTNVAFIKNDDISNFSEVYCDLVGNYKGAVKNSKYYKTNTIQNELDIIANIVGGGSDK